MAQPNIYSNDELLKCVKGLVLQIPNIRISMTQGNKVVFQRIPSDVPVLEPQIEYQKPGVCT